MLYLEQMFSFKSEDLQEQNRKSSRTFNLKIKNITLCAEDQTKKKTWSVLGFWSTETTPTEPNRTFWTGTSAASVTNHRRRRQYFELTKFNRKTNRLWSPERPRSVKHKQEIWYLISHISKRIYLLVRLQTLNCSWTPLQFPPDW